MSDDTIDKERTERGIGINEAPVTRIGIVPVAMPQKSIKKLLMLASLQSLAIQLAPPPSIYVHPKSLKDEVGGPNAWYQCFNKKVKK